MTFHRVRGPSRTFLLGYPWFLVAGSLILWRRRRGIVQATGAIVLSRVDAIAVHYCHQVGEATTSQPTAEATPSQPTALFRIYGRIVGRVKRTVERFCFRANPRATFVCVSDGVAEEMRTYFPELATGVVTIYNGVDTETFAPGRYERESKQTRHRLGIPPERRIAAFVGGEWERKGLYVALEALAKTSDWDLVVAGQGDEIRYRKAAASLGVVASVHWLGVVREIEVVFAMADAFVLPSSYETFSLVTFEAAASALPIVATPVSGVRELLQDGRNGFLITRDADVLAERLTQLAGDPELSEQLGRAARESSLRFSWDVMINEHDRLYSRLAEAG